MLSNQELALELGRADVAIRDSFTTTLGYLHTGRMCVGYSKLVQIDGSFRTPLVFAERCFVVVKGNLTTPVEFLSGGVLLIYGNLNASVKSSSHIEVIVVGWIEPSAAIEATDICRVYVSGDFSGNLTASAMAIVWVKGSFNGYIGTGSPSATIHIERNCSGFISPTSQAAMLYLTVGEFMSAESIRCIDHLGYLEFKAVVGKSDQRAGVYPPDADEKSKLRGIITRRWTVLSGE